MSKIAHDASVSPSRLPVRGSDTTLLNVSMSPTLSPTGGTSAPPPGPTSTLTTRSTVDCWRAAEDELDATSTSGAARSAASASARRARRERDVRSMGAALLGSTGDRDHLATLSAHGVAVVGA